MNTTTQVALSQENAQEALRRAKALLPMWAPLVRAIARNPKLKVELTGGAPCTDGKTVWLRVPIELAYNKHQRELCGKWDAVKNGYLCPACNVELQCDQGLFHEVAHLLADSFGHGDPDSELIELMKGRYVGWEDRFDQQALSIKGTGVRRNQSNTLVARLSAVFPDQWAFFSFNAVEDVYVNAKILEARPGLTPIFKASYEGIFRDGISSLDGSATSKWSDAHPSLQAIATWSLAAQGAPEVAMEYLDEEVVDKVMGSRVLRDLADKITKQRNAAARFKVAFKLLAELDELGLGVPDPPLPPSFEKPEEPDPGEGQPDSEGKPNEGPSDEKSDEQSSDSSEQEGQPEEGDGSESGKGQTKESGNPDAKGKPQQTEDKDTDSSESDTEANGSGKNEQEEEESEGEGSGDGSDSEDDADTEDGAAGSEADEAADGDAEDGDSDSGESEEGEGSDSDTGQESSAPSSAAGKEQGEGEQGEDAEGDSQGTESEATPDNSSKTGGSRSLDNGGTGATEDYNPDAEAASDVESTVELDFDVAKAAFEKLTGHDHFGEEWNPESVNPTEPVAQRETELVKSAVSFDGRLDDTGGLNKMVQNRQWSYRNMTPSFSHDGDDSIFELSLEVRMSASQQMRLAFAANKKTGLERNLRSGRKLDAKVLGTRIPTGDERIFANRSVPKKRDWTVLMGLDLSGSARRRALAIEKQIAIGVGDLLAENNIPFSVFGHTGTGDEVSGFDLAIIPVKGENEGWKGEGRKHVAGLHAAGGNLDGHTMQAYRKLLERQRGTDQLLLYFTDGAMPQANFSHEVDVLVNECAVLKAKGIHCIGVGIGVDSPRQYGLDTIQVDGPEDIPKLLAGIGERLTRRA